MTFFLLGVNERIGNKNKLIKLNKLLDWQSISKHLKGIHKNEIDPQGEALKATIIFPCSKHCY